MLLVIIADSSMIFGVEVFLYRVECFLKIIQVKSAKEKKKHVFIMFPIKLSVALLYKSTNKCTKEPKKATVYNTGTYFLGFNEWVACLFWNIMISFNPENPAYWNWLIPENMYYLSGTDCSLTAFCYIQKLEFNRLLD